MKIALHNTFFGQEVAETELARRIAVAARCLGWEAIEVATSDEIISLQPDFVLALHFRTPKLTAFPTYGCLWNPPSFMERAPEFVRNVLSYDAYLTSAEGTSQWVRDLLRRTAKRTFFAPFYTSCPRSRWRSPSLDSPRLVYLGTNWDGSRYPELFRELATLPYLDVYGPSGRWGHAAVAYRGPLPFDGESVLDVLNRSGAGLCLHRPEHRETGIPSPRIFEIAASGAIAICQKHVFIEEKFGDSVLYLDEGLGPAQMAAQIGERFNWIAENREKAEAMSQRAHAVFEREFSLEILLEEIGRRHCEVRVAEGLRKSARPSSQGHVQAIVRAGKRSPAKLSRALASIANQTYPDLSVLIVKHGPQDIESALGACRPGCKVEVIEVPPDNPRSTSLWLGLKAARGEFVANLDDDDVWFPNHLATLVPLVAGDRPTGLAYSGAVRRLEQDDPDAPALPAEPASLVYHDRYDREPLYSIKNYIASNAWVVRQELVREAGDDPKLDVWEDLLLLLRFAEVTAFAFSGEVTAQYFHRTSLADNAVFLPADAWEAAANRIRRMISKPTAELEVQR